MKTTLLILLAVCAAHLTAQDAASSNAAPLPQASNANSVMPIGGPATAQEHSAAADEARPPAGRRQSFVHPARHSKTRPIPTPSHAVVHKTSPPRQSASTEHPRSAVNARTQTQRRSNSGAFAKNGLIQNPPTHVAAMHPASTLPTASPSLSDARHRSSNPPMIGGAGPSVARNAGAINGSRMSCKP